ncbi:MAG: sigma-70 family RNA polymerase sigma factor [Anaerolineales bacterium]
MDEPELIRYAQQGDLDAFNRLIQIYERQVFNLAWRIMGDSDSAADATQEAFISAYKAVVRFRGGSFRSWMMRIVTNACYDELRRRKRRPAGSLEKLFDEVGVPEPDDPGDLIHKPEDPETATERAELSNAIQDCLNRLPDDFRVVAVLADVQGYEYGEVAQVIGKPLGTVKSRLARARARLRECLQRHRELLPATYRLEDESP